MKSLVLILSIIVAVYGQCEVPDDMKEMAKDCVKEAGLPDFMSFVKFNHDDPKVKAAAACMLKKSGTLVNGKIDLDKSLDVIMNAHPSSNDSWKPRIIECVVTANNEGNEGEVAYTMHKCFYEKICLA
uniref:Odorant-binding protein 21 n=1 Tax=Encarsia formosa TaxID=32400 RepID=A0A514TU08_ENCFO|nr:odorant-binding protein 21 [Encarsia formosa]